MTAGDDPTLQAARALAARTAASLGEGRVIGPVMAGGRLSASLVVSAEEAAGFEPARAAFEAALRALPGGAGARVTLTDERPPTTSPPKPARPLAGVRRVIAVASGKGGVGKSTTAVNLALALRGLGLRVGILDADTQGPSLPTLLGLYGSPRMGAGRKLLPMSAWGLSAMSMGLMVEPETAMIWRGPMTTAALTQMINEVEWGALDVLIIDMPPGTGDAQLAIAQGAPLAGAVIVSTPQDLALIDARRGVAMFRKIGVPILGIVENMSHFVCPDCGGRHAIFGEGGAEEEARRIKAPFLGAVPLAMPLRAASDAGRPLMAQDPEGPIGRIYTQIARRLLEEAEARAAKEQTT